MAQLVVRKLEEDVKARLQRRAKANARSLEEEVRTILRNAVRRDGNPPVGFGSGIAALFSEVGFEDGEIQELRGHEAKPALFD